MGRSSQVFLSTMLFVWVKVIETGLAVVGAHAALAETAEAHCAGGQMDDRVVDAAAAETATGGHHSGRSFCH